MTTTAPATDTTVDFKVADLALAGFGRKEIRLAEHEMPGLISMRDEYGPDQPLRVAQVGEHVGPRPGHDDFGFQPHSTGR